MVLPKLVIGQPTLGDAITLTGNRATDLASASVRLCFKLASVRLQYLKADAYE